MNCDMTMLTDDKSLDLILAYHKLYLQFVVKLVLSKDQHRQVRAQLTFQSASAKKSLTKIRIINFTI